MTMRDPRRPPSRRPMIIGAIVIGLAILIFAASMAGSFYDNRDHAPATEDKTVSGALPGGEPPAAH